MSEPDHWARTQDQIDLLHATRNRGGLCAACGRRLDAGETVYFERFDVGPRRVGEGTRQSQNWAPVGVECASPESLAYADERGPELCDGCGRGVVTFAGLARVLRVSMEVLLYGEEEAAVIAQEWQR